MSLIGRPLQLQQKYLHQSNKVASKISMLFKLAGYSSLAAALVSILIYWYKRYSPSNEMERKLLQEKDAIIGDELYITPKKRHSDFGYSNSLRRTSSTLSDISRDQVINPLKMSQNNNMEI